MDRSSTMRRMTWLGGALAAASCAAPWVLGIVGLGALGASAAYVEWIALGMFALGGAGLLVRRLVGKRGLPQHGSCRTAEDESEDEHPLVCDLTAIVAGDRAAPADNAKAVFGQVEHVVETDRGYLFRLPDHSDMPVLAAQFASLERFCGPFFELSVRMGPGRTPTWLELSGTPRVKQFIRDNVVQSLSNKQVSRSC